jgi:hypothetical protein
LAAVQAGRLVGGTAAAFALQAATSTDRLLIKAVLAAAVGTAWTVWRTARPVVPAAAAVRFLVPAAPPLTPAEQAELADKLLTCLSAADPHPPTTNPEGARSR